MLPRRIEREAKPGQVKRVRSPTLAATGVSHPVKSAWSHQASPTSPTPSGLPPPLPPAAPEGRQQSPGSGDAREAPPTHPTYDELVERADRLTERHLDADGFTRPQRFKPRTPFHQKPLSQQAAILCRDVAFQLWASAHLEGDAVREPKSCEIWLKRKLGIVSFTELDNVWIKFSNYPMRTFRDMVEQFEKSVGRIPA